MGLELLSSEAATVVVNNVTPQQVSRGLGQGGGNAKANAIIGKGIKENNQESQQLQEEEEDLDLPLPPSSPSSHSPKKKEKLKPMVEKQVSETPCDEECGDPAVIYCVQCEESLCVECNKNMHRRGRSVEPLPLYCGELKERDVVRPLQLFFNSLSLSLSLSLSVCVCVCVCECVCCVCAS